ncbi:hypothetical protein [Pararhodospirillum photometricum]|uniref:Lipoprotein n=1 Tax=Pararhodospirillum photometricum DSM 122 TaxID=1150469 RepID=H6SMR7_PARPM|nr:hypothetical protein [Pararhodospirillum photometricum]CCG09202.1 Putative uncharacterized protein [Pararhodospirillum photometricum DSM 122]
MTPCFRWSRRCGGLVLILALAVAGCAAFEPVAPEGPVSGTFDAAQSQAALATGEAAEASGDLESAFEAYRQAARWWPVSRPAWQALARVSAAQGDAESERLALFLEERVEDYDALHPRQARLAFVGAGAHPPAGLDGLVPWAEVMVAFFEEKDLSAQRAAFAGRDPRSRLERYAIYPVAVGSLGGAVYSLGTAASSFASEAE